MYQDVSLLCVQPWPQDEYNIYREYFLALMAVAATLPPLAATAISHGEKAPRKQFMTTLVRPLQYRFLYRFLMLKFLNDQVATWTLTRTHMPCIAF